MLTRQLTPRPDRCASTDNGGFYHYSIGNNKSLGTNYEEVLPKVKAYHEEIGVGVSRRGARSVLRCARPAAPCS